MWSGVISHYQDRLPSVVRESPVTLLEGNTPLLPAPRLAEALGVRATVLLKCEGVNPTGSFKDRGMTVAITAAKRAGVARVICASTGNTSASAAAYAAQAGLQAVVVIPRGNVAEGKLAQAIMHGATIVQIDDNFDRALEIVRQLADDEHMALVNSTNPYRLEGQKTAAFEICDTLGDTPDYHFLPVGNAGNITAYWMGYREYVNDGIVRRCPRMMGYQAAGAAPIVRGHPVDRPDTFATAIRIGNPASWKGAELARDQSGGTIDDVTDEEIRTAYELVARTEGIFIEPASAAGVAGLRKFNAHSSIDHRVTVVCTLTGHGLKDPTSTAEAKHEIFQAPADLQYIRTLIER